MRTDRRRLRPLLVDQPDTTALRQLTRARKDLLAHRIAVANQLRAHLQIVFPGAVGLFADIDSGITLRFLERFGSQDRADWLSVRRWAAWLAAAGYCGRAPAETVQERLSGAPRGASGPAGDTLPGVISSRVGFTGGENVNPTYRNHPGHAEDIEIVFDPSVTTYRHLLTLFFQIHDPSTLNRQGNDIGTSYRSAIFPLGPEQERVARDTIADVDASGLWPGKAVTTIEPAATF